MENTVLLHSQWCAYVANIMYLFIHINSHLRGSRFSFFIIGKETVRKQHAAFQPKEALGIYYKSGVLSLGLEWGGSHLICSPLYVKTVLWQLSSSQVSFLVFLKLSLALQYQLRHTRDFIVLLVTKHQTMCAKSVPQSLKIPSKQNPRGFVLHFLKCHCLKSPPLILMKTSRLCHPLVRLCSWKPGWHHSGSWRSTSPVGR